MPHLSFSEYDLKHSERFTHARTSDSIECSTFNLEYLTTSSIYGNLSSRIMDHGGVIFPYHYSIELDTFQNRFLSRTIEQEISVPSRDSMANLYNSARVCGEERMKFLTGVAQATSVLSTHL